MEYTPSEVIGMIKTYKKDQETYERLKAEFNIGVTTGVDAPKYGIEASMPGTNSISDPTHNMAISLMNDPQIIKNMERKIKFINDRSIRLYKDQHMQVFVLRINGYVSKHIGETIGVTRTRVQNIINEIAQLMCKSEEEYILYCNKKGIKPKFN